MSSRLHSGWPSAMMTEPLDRYRETEDRRAAGFLSAAFRTVQKRALELEQQRRAQLLAQQQGFQMPAKEPPKKKGNSLWGDITGGIDAVTPDALEGPTKKVGSGALTALGLPTEYIGKPAVGVLTGTLTSKQRTDANGQTYRDAPSVGDAFHSWGKALTQDPRKTYQQSRQAETERARDPQLQEDIAGKVGLSVITDPTSYVPGGFFAKALPAGVAVSRGGRLAAGLLENSREAAIGGTAGSIGGGYAAKKVGLPEGVGEFGGGLLGGIGAGGATAAFRSATSARADAAAIRQAARSNPSPTIEGIKAIEDSTSPSAPSMAEYAKPQPPLPKDQLKTLYGDKPYTENYTRAEPLVARGRKALLDRIDSEVSDFRSQMRKDPRQVQPDELRGGISTKDTPKGVTPAMAASAKDFINAVPEKYLERLGSSFVTLGGKVEKNSGLPSNPGTYASKVAMDGGQDFGLIRIVKGLAEKQPEPERVIIHEIAHHLEQFVDKADAEALRKEFRYELGVKGGVKLGKGLETLKGVAEGDIPAYQGYRYKNLEGGFSEWFAENIADRALGTGGKEAAGHWQRAWEAVKDIADTAYRWLTRQGDKGAADRVYERILGGEYNAARPENSITAKMIRGEDANGQSLALEDFSPPPLDRSNAYTILGAEEGDDLATLKKKYRQLMRQYHPDINKSATAADDAKAINNAFDQAVNDFDRFKWQGVPGFAKGAAGAGASGTHAGTGGPPPGGTNGGQSYAGGAGNPPPNGGQRSGFAQGGAPGSAGQTPPPGAGFNQPPPPKNPGKPPKVKTPDLERKDMFDTISRADRIREEAAFQATVRGKADSGIRRVAKLFGGEQLDPNLTRDPKLTSFTVQEKNRLENMIRSFEGKADDLWAEVENSGLKVTRDANGDFRMDNGVSFEDMAELATPQGRQAYAALTHRQRQAVDALSDFNEELNANLRFHAGKNMGFDTVQMSTYFPRMAKGINGQEFVRGAPTPGAKLGGKGFPFHERTQQTFEEGIQNGVDYAHPRESFRMMTRAKLQAAKNEALANRLKPLGLKQLPPGAHANVDYVQVSPQVAPALNGRWFKPEDAKRIEAAFKGTPAFEAKPVKIANRALTPLRATGDVSWFGQQGAALLFRHPVQAVKGSTQIIRSAFGNREAYDNLMKGLEKDGFDKTEAIKHGLHWTGDDLSDQDYGFLKAKVTDKPVLRQAAKTYNKVAAFSNETFSRYQNFVRGVYAKDAQERLAKLKSTMSPEEWRKEYQGAMSAVNRVSGFSGRKPTSLESMVLFAPRYTEATVEQIAAAVSRGGLEGSIARRQLYSMLAGGAALAIAANQVSGNETDLDPRSPNFLRIRRLGGLDVSPFGSYDTLFRAIAGTLGGEPEGESAKLGPLNIKRPTGDLSPDITKLWRTAEAKMSPALKLVYEPFVKGSTYTGEPLDPTSVGGWGKIAKEQLVASAPFSVQNAIDEMGGPALKGDVKGVLQALPGEVVSAAGFANNPVTPSENRDFRRDKVAEERFGMRYADLSGAQKSIVNEDEQVKNFQSEADTNTLTRADDRAKMQGAQIEAQSRIQAATERFKNSEISGSEFRDAYHDIQTWLAGNRDALGEGTQDDSDLKGWWALGDQARRADGTTDYELLDSLQADYRLRHPAIDDKLDAITGTHDNQVMRDFRVAQKEAKEFYSLPRYKGMSQEEGDRAGEVLDLVRRMTTNDQAVNTKAALRYLTRIGAITDDDARLAIRANRLGTSRERTAYASSHPLFAQFYRDALVSVNGMAAPEVGSAPGSNGGGPPKPGQSLFGTTRKSGVRTSLFSTN